MERDVDGEVDPDRRRGRLRRRAAVTAAARIFLVDGAYDVLARTQHLATKINRRRGGAREQDARRRRGG